MVAEAGVTNSADWWPVEGTMMDFNYIFSNCLELTMELACDWIPEEELIQVSLNILPDFAFNSFQPHWLANKEPMLAFLEEADKMVRGIVTDGVSLPIAFSLRNNVCRLVIRLLEPL